MSITAPRYASAPVPLTDRTARVWAIASREFFRRGTWGPLAAVTITYMAVVLFVVVSVYLSYIFGDLSTSTFGSVYSSPVWPFLILLVAAGVGAGSLADDVGNRTITLYLSRPIKLDDYVMAKTIACGGWILIASVGPGLFAVGVVAALGYASLTVVGESFLGFLATGLIVAVFFTGFALALSSLTNRALYAGVAIFGLVLATFIGASIVAGITGNAYVPYANPFVNIESIAHGAFFVPGIAATNPIASAVVMLGTGVFLWCVASWRMTRVEVVTE